MTVTLSFSLHYVHMYKPENAFTMHHAFFGVRISLFGERVSVVLSTFVHSLCIHFCTIISFLLKAAVISQISNDIT